MNQSDNLQLSPQEEVDRLAYELTLNNAKLTGIHDSNDPAHADCEVCQMFAHDETDDHHEFIPLPQDDHCARFGCFAPRDAVVHTQPTVALWYCGIYSGPYIVNVVPDNNNDLLRTIENWPYKKSELFTTEKEAVAHARKYVISEIDCLTRRVNELDARYDELEDEL